MFFKPIKQTEWLSPDFLENLEAFEVKLNSDALSRPVPQQLFSKLTHLTRAFIEILIKHLNNTAYDGNAIRKLLIFTDVSNILLRLNNCNEKLKIILNDGNTYNKKLKVDEGQSSKSFKQEELTPESVPGISRKRKINENLLGKLEEISQLITFLNNMSTLVNTSVTRFEKDIFAGLEDLAIIQTRQEIPSTPEEITIFNTFSSVPSLMTAIYSTTKQILTEMDMNKDLLVAYKDLGEIQKNGNEDQNIQATKLIELSMCVQDIITEILTKKINFIRENIALRMDRVKMLQGFIESFPIYDWEGIMQLLTIIGAELQKCFKENTAEEQQFLKNIALEINDASLINQLLISAKDILDEYLLSGDLSQTIINLESKHEQLVKLRKNFSTIESGQDTLSAKLCDFIIESAEDFIGHLNETKEAISLSAH